MLVLTRRTKEAIEVDGPARIFIGKVSGNSVKLVIQAPGSTKVIRSEIGTLPPAIAASLDDDGGIDVDRLIA